MQLPVEGRTSDHQSIAYILGSAEFLGLSFNVYMEQFTGDLYERKYTFTNAIFVTSRPIHILIFNIYIPRYICDCFRCSLLTFCTE